VTDSVEKARGLETLAIQDIMKTKGGRDFMWRLLEQSGVFIDGFDNDPYKHARSAGKRSQGLWLQRELQESANGSYMIMLKENSNE